MNYEARKTRDRINQRITPERISSLSLTVRRRRSVICVNNSLDGLSAMFIRWQIQRWNNPEGDSRRRGRMNVLDHSRGKRVRAVDYSARSVRQPSPWVSGRTSGNPPRSSLRFTNDRRVSTVVTSWRMMSMCNVRLNSCAVGTKRLQSAVLLSFDGLDWRPFGSFPDEPVAVFLKRTILTLVKITRTF